MIEYFEEGDDAFLFFMVLAKIGTVCPTVHIVNLS